YPGSDVNRNGKRSSTRLREDPPAYCQLSGSMPIRSFKAFLRRCLQPGYLLVAWTETWPDRNWIWSNSPPASRHRRAQVVGGHAGPGFQWLPSWRIPARRATRPAPLHRFPKSCLVYRLMDDILRNTFAGSKYVQSFCFDGWFFIWRFIGAPK